MNILETVKTLCTPPVSVDDVFSDDVLGLYIDMVIIQVLNYCNLAKLPTALEYTVAKMAADMYSENTAEQRDTGQITGAVSSISEGGRTVSFATRVNKKSLSEQANEHISKMNELNKFKQLYRMG